jgi:rubrerythrin
MAGIFQVSEVVAIAVEIERRGERFYLDMAERATNPKVKEGLVYLASEEVRHRKVYEDLLSRLRSMELPPGSGESEYWSYVNDLIDSHFLFDTAQSERLFSAATSDQEVVRLAMGFEKESILFFTEMKGLVPGEEAAVIDTCIQEERTHLRRLGQLLKSIT